MISFLFFWLVAVAFLVLFALAVLSLLFGRSKVDLTPVNRCWRYRKALEEIAALSHVTEMRGPLETIGVPTHAIKEGGWVPIHPRFKDGLVHAAKIAQAALDEAENEDAQKTEPR